MVDLRPQPWSLAPVTVFGGYRVMWTRWLWDAAEEEWEWASADSPDPHVYLDEDSAWSSASRLSAMDLAPPFW